MPTQQKLCCVLLSLLLSPVYATAQEESGFKPLFNGKNLDGWNTTGNWIVEKDKSITLKPRPGERGWQRYKDYLTTERQYGNFILDLEFKFNAKGNS